MHCRGRLIKQLVQHGPKRECPLIHDVRASLNARTPCALGEAEALVIQAGVAEMLLRFAAFDNFADEKQAVAATVKHLQNDWFGSDVERIDMRFIGDVHALAKANAAALDAAYGAIH